MQMVTARIGLALPKAGSSHDLALLLPRLLSPRSDAGWLGPGLSEFQGDDLDGRAAVGQSSNQLARGWVARRVEHRNDAASAEHSAAIAASDGGSQVVLTDPFRTPPMPSIATCG
jgi:hypothetical protein